MKDIFGSLRRIGALFVLGLLLIICLALGVVLFQQTARQRDLRDQVAKLTLTVNQPLQSAEKLKADYEKVLISIPFTDPKVVLEDIVKVARSSGIDVRPESEKFLVPAQLVLKDARVGDMTFQIMTFRDIKAQGNYEKVMSFIGNLESGDILKTAVVKTVSVSLTGGGYMEEPEYIARITVDVYTRRKE